MKEGKEITKREEDEGGREGERGKRERKKEGGGRGRPRAWLKWVIKE